MNCVGAMATRVLGVALLGMLAACSMPPTNQVVMNGSGVPEPAQSYIVEGQSTDVAANAVQDAGGRVTSRLGVIDAVEADLTDAQHEVVLKSAGIKQITTNSIVMTNAAANVVDRFETSSFANNDGTHRWYGDWVETNDDNQPWGGKVVIGWPEHGGNRMIIGSNGSVYRKAATPTSSATVTLKFKYSRFGFEYGDYLSIQASANGSTWTEIGRITGAGSDSSFVSKSYSITAYRGRNTTIRFVGGMNEGFPSDYIDLDRKSVV